MGSFIGLFGLSSPDNPMAAAAPAAAASTYTKTMIIIIMMIPIFSRNNYSDNIYDAKKD